MRREPGGQSDVQQADGHGKNTGVCGDTVEMFLFISGVTITRASFRINGCATTLACAAAVAAIAEGETLQAAWDITPNSVLDAVGPLPPESEHCAELAVGAFYLALSDYWDKKRAPWKKLYQKD